MLLHTQDLHHQEQIENQKKYKILCADLFFLANKLNTYVLCNFSKIDVVYINQFIENQTNLKMKFTNINSFLQNVSQFYYESREKNYLNVDENKAEDLKKLLIFLNERCEFRFKHDFMFITNNPYLLTLVVGVASFCVIGYVLYQSFL